MAADATPLHATRPHTEALVDEILTLVYREATGRLSVAEVLGILEVVKVEIARRELSD